MSKRPNIVIFNPDQMRTDSMGHMGNPAAVTPNLDSFATKEAVSFSDAYCQNPVCVPSRCSFFTGLYPHVHGHRTMAHLLRAGETSMFKELKEAGYYVWMNSRNDLVAGQYPGLVESHASEIYYHKPETGKNVDLKAIMAARQKTDEFPYSHYKGKLEVPMGGDDADVKAAIDRILNPVESEKPLLLFLGLQNPHPDYAVEDPFYSSIDRSKIPCRIKGSETDGKPLMHSKLKELQKLQDYGEDNWNELRATYLGQCSKVDSLFGKVCDALKQANIYDDTAIFVLSDHGDYTGDYDIPEKSQNTFEDCLVRVPLLIKPPKGESIDPGISDSLVELVDFYATVMDYADVKPQHDHFGKTLRPILANRSISQRDYVFCEGGRMEFEIHCDELHADASSGQKKTDVYWPRKTAQADPIAHTKATMIRDKNHKYVRRMYENDEFYDLTVDSNECHNVIDEPMYAGKINEMRLAMLEWFQATSDIVPYDYDGRFTEEGVWTMVCRFVPMEDEEKVRQEIRDSGCSIQKGLEIMFRYISGN